ncbi:MAG: ribosome-binding factor A [Candidatus Brennerbacteria bacterium]|nr:ribosome-binding factor A [Candidatus Brennerbacteria bacterium]
MRPYRNLKMEDLIEEELGKLIAREVYVEGALITITDVFITPDLLQARVKLGIIPKAKELEAFLAVEKQLLALRHALVRKINVKPMPRISIEIDKVKQ